MTIRSSSSSGIPFGNNAGRPSSPNTGQPYFNGEAGRLELYTTNGWNNIVQETPGVSSVAGHYYQSDNQGTFVVSGTNFVDGAIAYALGTNGIEYGASSTTYNSLVQLTVVFQNLSAAYEPYDIKVTNPSNLFGLLPDAFYVNDSPVWTTSAGSLGSVYANASVSKTVAATDDESNTITYSSSDLPSWLSLNSSTGVLTGTSPVISSDTTYTFNITASDGLNTAVSRQFNIPVVAVSAVSGGTLSSDSTYFYRAFTGNGSLVVSGKSLTSDSIAVAGGGGGGGASPWWTSGGGGGAGGLVYSASTVFAAGTYSVAVGAGGAGNVGLGDNESGSKGANSSITGGSLSLTTALGGGRGRSYGEIVNSSTTGGSGGGGGGPHSGSYPAGFGTAGQGNNGGNANSTYTSSGNQTNGSGGGGGAGAVGGDAGGSNGGGGGAGSSSYSSWGSATSTGHNVSGTRYYAGGGGAGAASTAGLGGNGGGGNGAQGADEYNGSNGTVNTGGGGGGAVAGSNNGGAVSGGTGGSGIVIFRYLKSEVGG